MRTRYQQLRDAVATLAATADEQAAWLDRLFAPLVGDGDAAAYGNDELAMTLDDIFVTAEGMLEHGELQQAGLDAIRPRDTLLDRLSGEQNADFWRREALYEDARWDEVRRLAGQALAVLADEPSQSTFTP